MIPRTLAAFIAAATLAAAQGPVDQARADLDKAVKELSDTQREYADLRRALYRDINRLDDEALNLARELRTLQRADEERVASSRRLENEIEARKTDFNYSSGILNQYSKALVTRLHPAENQLHLDAINGHDQKAASSAEDPTAELLERAKVLELGLERLGQVAGGQTFDGKALRNGSEAIQGAFLVAGPSVYFAAKDDSFEGVATFAQTGTELPTVVAIQDARDSLAKVIRSGAGTLPFDGTMGKAIEVAAARDTLADTIRKGGYVGYAILGLGAISMLIAIFKIFEVTRLPVPSRSLVNTIIDDLLGGRPDDAKRKADAIHGPVGALVATGVARFYEKRRVLEEALFEKLVTIKPRLERFLPFLALTAAAAPLMGLLGTVLGIIKTFQAMALYGTGNAKNFSAGISEALITTAQGLVVAIPVLVIHGLLKSFVKGRFGEIEGVGIALLNGTTERERKSGLEADGGDADDEIVLDPTPA